MNYTEKLQHFRKVFEEQHQERQMRLYPNTQPDTIGVITGYKFDKIYTITDSDQRLGRYMVESRTGSIYAIKSWTQVNKRRQYGTLDTVDQYDWSEFYARPLPGTEAERLHVERETEIKSTHKKRGRKPLVERLNKPN